MEGKRVELIPQPDTITSGAPVNVTSLIITEA